MAAPAEKAETLGRRLIAHAPLGALLVAGASLVAPIARNGIWDPYELRSLDLARRIGLNLFGGAGLALDGVENALPSRGELDRGELPFTSMALGLRAFGLSAWAGRLPLCLWGLAGLVMTYVLVARLADRVAAALSVLVLATMPLYFVHARTLLGDGVTMAALAMAVSGLALALFDRASSGRQRVGWLLLGLLGLGAGALSRGLLFGVAVPALGVGLGWLVSRLNRATRPEAFATWVGFGTLGLGLAATVAGLLVLQRALAHPEQYFPWLGFGLTAPLTPPTFDAILQQLGHGLFPWSALLPAAMARLALRPSSAEDAPEGVALRTTLVTLVGVAITVSGGLAPVAGVLPFGAVAPLAVVIGLALRDIDLGAPPSRTLGLLAGALGLLLLIDFKNFPEELLGVFGVGSLKFPESFRDSASALFTLGTLGAATLFFFATAERPRVDGPAFERRDYLAWLRTLRDLWDGNLLFGLLVVEAALLGFFAFDLLGERVPALARFVTESELGRVGARFGWLALPAVLALPLPTLGMRDALRAVDRLRASTSALGWVPARGSLALLGVAVFASTLSLFYYPALADQLSPQQSFEAYRRFARAGEPLGLVGPSSAVAPFYAGRGVVSFRGPEEAYRWLLEPGERRFLVLRSDALAGLNSRYRMRVSAERNLPVLDAHSSEILLVSNQLRPGEKSENPLDAYLLSQPPQPMHRLDANLGDQLDVLGWDVTSLDDQPVREIVPQRRYRFVIYYRVAARIAGSWETFVHIDGFQRRFNGDHKTLDGRYAFALWQVGDLIADRHEMELEPNFTPGTYQVYFGLYSGSRRLPVRRGAHHEDRIAGGGLVVR